MMNFVFYNDDLNAIDLPGATSDNPFACADSPPPDRRHRLQSRNRPPPRQPCRRRCRPPAPLLAPLASRTPHGATHRSAW